MYSARLDKLISPIRVRGSSSEVRAMFISATRGRSFQRLWYDANVLRRSHYTDVIGMCEATTPGVQVAALNLESPLNASEIQSVGGPT